MTGRRPRSTEHGQYGYARREKCRCDPCLRVQRRYTKELAFDNHNGRQRRVDAQPVRDHCFEIVQAGASPGMIAKATHGVVVKEQVKRLLYGNPTTGKPVTWLHRGTADSLLSVTVEEALKHDLFTHSIGTKRRFEALAAMGHGKEDVARELGVHWSNLYEYTYVERVTVTTAENVRRVYARLSMTPGSNEVMRWKARRLGWLPPFAWDDHTIDDPLAEPDLEAVKCVVENCSRSISKAMLCNSHYRKVVERGGLKRSKSYREVVLSLAKVEIHDREAFLDDLRECREMGMTVEGAAMHLGRKLAYVSKHWSKAI